MKMSARGGEKAKRLSFIMLPLKQPLKCIGAERKAILRKRRAVAMSETEPLPEMRNPAIASENSITPVSVLMVSTEGSGRASAKILWFGIDNTHRYEKSWCRSRRSKHVDFHKRQGALALISVENGVGRALGLTGRVRYR